ncbi:MAG: purine-nucleoside phosphorylase [Bdellovibrionales bacterium]|nr:purine-nucleoside phosphorylase [Bdellovibrionales bacterium]
MSFFKKYYDQIKIKAPVCHFVLGSGFSSVLDKVKEKRFFKNWEEKKACVFKDIPNFPLTTVKSHPGVYRFFTHKASQKSISFQCGRLHLYEGHSPETVVKPVMSLLLSGTKQFVLSNISGALKKEYRVGHILALKDHVNFTGLSPLTGPEKTTDSGQKIGHRFPDMSQIYSKEITEKISKELLNMNCQIHSGIYVGVQGPELETPAYIKWLNTSSQGLFDVVGMSTVLESIALRQGGAKLAAFSVISNPAAGLDPNYKELTFSKMFLGIEDSLLKLLEAYFIYSQKHLILS